MRDSLSAALFGALLALIGLNALLFAVKAVNPLIASDAWHVVDTVLRQVPAGQFDIGDLFAKRAAGFDHAQPLRKLILLFHYRFFDLDFSIEAIIGVVAAFLNLAILWWMARREDTRPASTRPLQLLLFATLAAAYLSLNSSVVFGWSLVTLNYTTHVFLLAFLACGWWALQGEGWPRLAALFLAALAMDVVGDDTALIATLAACVPIALAALHGDRRRRGLEVAATALSAYLVYKIGYGLLAPQEGARGAGTGAAIAKLLPQLGSQVGDAWKWIQIPLTASVAQRAQLRSWFGTDTTVVEVVIALALALGHAWFWWRALRRPQRLAGFVAIALMMLFYGLVAAMVITRVSAHGADYLWQPRYALIYEWNLVALLLMALGQLGLAHSGAVQPGANRMPRARAAGAVVASACVVLLLLQVPLSLNSWRSVRFLSTHQQKMAAQLGELARDPLHAPQACAPELVVCRYPPARRQQVIQFLRANRLNLFSPGFQARNRLYPDAAALPQ